MVNERAIYSESGEVCGQVRSRICNSEEDLNESLNFSAVPGGFGPYREQIQLEEIWPMLLIDWLEVYAAHKWQGFGKRALRKLLEEAYEAGGRVAFFRVGWSGEDWEAEKKWRIEWYRREGFIELKNAARGLEVPFMYRPL